MSDIMQIVDVAPSELAWMLSQLADVGIAPARDVRVEGPELGPIRLIALSDTAATWLGVTVNKLVSLRADPLAHRREARLRQELPNVHHLCRIRDGIETTSDPSILAAVKRLAAGTHCGFCGDAPCRCVFQCSCGAESAMPFVHRVGGVSSLSAVYCEEGRGRRGREVVDGTMRWSLGGLDPYAE